MWRRLLWWSTERPAVLPWAVFLSVLLLVAGEGARLTVAGVLMRVVYAPFSALRYRIGAGADVFAENRRLQERLAHSEVENQRLREEGSENIRLRRLVEFSPSWRAQMIAAEVIGQLSPGSGVIWIGAGSRRLIQADWPVVTEDGLVGRVVDAGPDDARVRTLWDHLLRVAACDQRTRVPGVITWESGPDLRFSYVLRSADIAVGDSVVSSGWGGVFPEGLFIGTVARIDTSMTGEYLEIGIRPGARPDRLEMVFVVRPLPAGIPTGGTESGP